MDSDRIDAARSRQQEQSPNEQPADLDTLIRGLNQLVAIMLRYATDPQACKMLARLIAAGADGVFIPDSGSGNFALVGAMMNRTEQGIEKMTKRESIPITKPVQDRIIRFADINPEPEKASA